MKKAHVFFAAVILVALGCKSAPAPQARPEPLSAAPAWAAELPPEDAFWGIGVAKLQNENLAMQTATSRARRDVAEQMSVQVQGMLTDYAKESGLVDDTRSIVSIENVGREIVNLNLTGAVLNKREQMPDGTWWVRISVSKTEVKGNINDIINHEMADFAEFQAARALQMLDTQLDRLQFKPTPRSED